MAFFDSFRRKNETAVKEIEKVSKSTTDYIPKANYLEQATFRPAADWLRSNTQEEKPFFKWITNPTPVGRAVKVPLHIPTVGEKVCAKYNNTILYLKKALMTDHISVTYATNNMNYFAKIYISDVLQLDMLENKAFRMLQEKVEIPGVCWPVDMLTDNNGYFVGILVPASKGVQLTRSVFNGATGLSQSFPQWDKKDLCVLTMTILVCCIVDI